LAQFVSAAVDSLSNVEAAVSSGDPDRIKAATHGAKGEARYAAATGLAGLYSELESNAKSNDRAASQELIARIAVEVRRVEHFIRERLGAKVS
jgi:HPt (histidine-containing phosphotransfer) domain-containing protein